MVTFKKNKLIMTIDCYSFSGSKEEYLKELQQPIFNYIKSVDVLDNGLSCLVHDLFEHLTFDSEISGEDDRYLKIIIENEKPKEYLLQIQLCIIDYMRTIHFDTDIEESEYNLTHICDFLYQITDLKDNN